MLDYDYIMEHTKWVVKLNSGRIICTEKELSKYNDNPNVRDIDTVCWEGQPKDLQPFYKAYYNAVYNQQRDDLFLLKDFYNEWSKNPDQFTEEHQKVISKLSTELEQLDLTDDLIIENFDKQVIGNHRVGNYIEALEIINSDYDVIQVTEKYGYKAIIIQEDNQDKIEQLSYESNASAIRHDRYLGDGKFYKK